MPDKDKNTAGGEVVFRPTCTDTHTYSSLPRTSTSGVHWHPAACERPFPAETQLGGLPPPRCLNGLTTLLHPIISTRRVEVKGSQVTHQTLQSGRSVHSVQAAPGHMMHQHLNPQSRGLTHRSNPVAGLMMSEHHMTSSSSLSFVFLIM